MARSPIREWMPFEIDRFFGSARVRQMRDFQVGWYVSLLLRAWQAEPPCHLPDDENELMIMAGATSERSWKEHSALVLGAFRATGDGYRVNERQLSIYQEKLGIHNVNKENGSKGGRPKKTESKPNGNQTVSESSNSPSPVSAVVVAVGSESFKEAVPVYLDLQTFDGEAWFERIMEFWPYKDRDYRTQTAFIDECERIWKLKQWPQVKVAEWLIEQLRPIAEVIRKEYPQSKWKLYPLAKVLKQYENGAESFKNFELNSGLGVIDGNKRQSAGDRFSAALRKSHAPDGQ